MEAARRVSKAALWGQADTADELTERICPSIGRSEISTARRVKGDMRVVAENL
jgi:hypothetical protein